MDEIEPKDIAQFDKAFALAFEVLLQVWSLGSLCHETNGVQALMCKARQLFGSTNQEE